MASFLHKLPLGVVCALAGSTLLLAGVTEATEINGSAKWEVEFSSNLWLPETTTRFGTPNGVAETVLSVGDALDSLDLGVMFTLSARKNRWGMAADIVYLNLEADEATPFGLLYDRLESETTLFIPSIYGFYTAWDWEGGALDVGLGARYVDSDVDVHLTAGAAPEARTSQGESWADPLVAIRARGQLGEKWIASLGLDAGGGGNTEGTWQAVALVGYQMTDSWTIRGGYRHLYIARDTSEGPYDFEMSGVILGLAYQF